ncbi:hypothetical protein [Candidatus Rhodobacter oscarellae]|uniref:hypothetical protein n=1 Tax=Candidatus Rhodobacter oscarellae TaxID=1675527 RepID=UPI000A81EADB|nr:hypothetical protein [Candidatus Rhodobacter lobularis]
MRLSWLPALLLLGCSPQQAQIANPIADPLVGQTSVSFTPQHGFQIEYVETVAKSWLWYPGNRVSLPAIRRSSATEICYTYGKSTFNPVTSQSGGTKTCIPKSIADFTTLASVPGDVFALSTGKVPYNRKKCDPTRVFANAPIDPDLFRRGCE